MDNVHKVCHLNKNELNHLSLYEDESFLVYCAVLSSWNIPTFQRCLLLYHQGMSSNETTLRYIPEGSHLHTAAVKT
jgi:hypothetical protein